MTRVAVLDDYQNVALSSADWSALPPDVEVSVFHDHLSDQDAVVDRLREFDVVVAMRERTPFSSALLERLPRLRLLVTTASHNASIAVDATRRLGIVLCGTDSEPYPTAELTWGLILGLLRHIGEEDAAVRAGKWQVTLGTSLDGKTLGVIGLGRLGLQVAGIGRAFRMSVLAWSQNLTAERAAEAGAEAVGKEELLERADVVTVHVALSARTRGLLGAADLGRMKPTAILVNTSRGPVVDERALVDALRAGTIAGAALDVFDEEPLPLDHPLRRLPNTLVTPHIGYVTRETYRMFYGDAVENIAAFLRGEPIRVIESDPWPDRRIVD